MSGVFKSYVRAPPPPIAARMSFALEPPRISIISARLSFSDELMQRNVDKGQEAPNTRDEDAPEFPSSPACQERVPKPSGEPGRPGSGGYSLDSQLLESQNWSRRLYNEVVASVHAEADKNLDKTLSFKAQDAKKVALICAMMTRKWNFLSKYDNCWPIRDMLKLHLKYTSEAKHRANQAAEGSSSKGKTIAGLRIVVDS